MPGFFVPGAPMTRSSSTRRGHGAGWGGPAKGAGNHDAGPGRPRKEAAEVIAMAKEARSAALKDQLLTLAFEAEREETQLQASVAYLNREEGMPVARHDMTTQGQRIGYVIPAPPEAESAEAWTEQYKPH